MSIRRDFNGREIELEDLVITAIGQYKDLKRGIVVAFTPKMVRVRFIDGYDGYYERAITGRDLIVVNDLLPAMPDKHVAAWMRVREKINE